MNYGDTALGVECALPRQFEPEEPRRRAPGAWKGGSGHGLGITFWGARRLRQSTSLMEEPPTEEPLCSERCYARSA